MKTKLVYVLTCKPTDTYIEQALIAVWSVRYWNKSADIILLTDDLTSRIIHTDSKRGLILKYISEEIVTSFDAEKSMQYRSRWIKTKVRELVSGDILFVDSDTICCRSLDSVDGLPCMVGAVPESHLPIVGLNEQMQREIEEKAQKIGWSISTEDIYYSSGVIYSKDTPESHELYSNWHERWLFGIEKGIHIDQPSLAYANIKCNHIIERIPDSYNCILFTEPQNTRSAHILHVAAFRNPSYLFTLETLNSIRENGLNDAKVKKMLVNPCLSFRPFKYDILHSSICERISWIKDLSLLENGYLRAAFWMLRQRISVIRHKKKIKKNACGK